jgi:uncharacterized protein YaiE (UPF0345 family)
MANLATIVNNILADSGIDDVNVAVITGSNQFNGSQAITGSLTVTGQVVAQTLNVQQVTSSIVYSSGSNIFGNDLGNTQQFTGSLQVSGSSHYVLGNVGIGKTSPSFKLDILGSDNSQLRLDSSDALDTTIIMDYNGGGSTGRVRIRNANGNLAFNTANSAERMRITSTGNVGIGTASPAQKLDVVGKFRVTDDIILAQTNGRIDYDNGVTGALRFYSTSTATERMRITSAGNVGIGTDSPGRLLTLNASIPVLQFTNPTTGVTQDDGLLIYQNGLNSIIENQEAGYLGFLTSATERLRITSDGGVLIGRTTQAFSPSTQGYMLSVGSSVTQAVIALAASGQTLGSGGVLYGLDSTRSFIVVRENLPLGFDTNDTERMRITSGGNVLIGTPTSNNHKLEIIGGATSGLRIDVNSGVSGIAMSPGAEFNIDQPGVGGGTFKINSSGNVGIGTASPSQRLHVANAAGGVVAFLQSTATNGEPSLNLEGRNSSGTVRSVVFKYDNADILRIGTSSPIDFRFETNDIERMRITSGGAVLFQKQAVNNTDTGAGWFLNDYFCVTNNSADSGDRVILINRQNSDGELIEFRQGNIAEGDITISGTTVSYNGGHLSRYSQTELNEKIESLLKGTVMSNLDQMAEWINPETGEPYENEQLNCMKISDVEGDKNVAGVFVNWQYDSELLTNDMNIAMTGDMIIRIAEGVVVEKGDLLISAGDGTAKPQSDDLIRSNTIAKVISNHVTCTYEDGSYCVPCVLMAC